MKKLTLLLAMTFLLAVPLKSNTQQTLYGDVNGDLETNIADVNSVIDIILDNNGYTVTADVNGDGEINIADINAIIDIILGGGIDQHLLEVCERVVEIDNEIIDYYEQCTSIDELMTHKDEIEAMDGVEYVFSNDNTTMYVVIKDFGTISYSYFPKLLKSNTPNLQIFKYEAGGLMANADVTHCNNINPSDAKALIAFQMSKDEGSSSVTDYSYCEILNTYFKYAGIDSRIETSLDIKFFRDSIFDCDYLFLLTHGDYEFNPDKYKKDKTYRGIHWVFTTEELPTDSHEEARFLREIKKKYSEDDVSYGTIKETHNGVDVGVRYLKVSDHFIESSNKSFDHPGKAIVFNTACHSMQGPGILENNEDKVNYNFGRVFARCGAGAYYGYDQSNSHGSACASQLFTYLISGMSVQSAYDNLQFEMLHDHKFDESTNTWHWADLIPYYVNEVFKNSCITKPLIDYRDVSNDNELSIVLASGIPAFSIVFSDISYEYDDNNNFVETFEDNYTDLSDILRYGFELSESEQFVDAISLGEKRIGDEGCKWLDNPPMYLYFKESLTYSPSDSDSKIKPGTTYWARAYVYDGSGYNYSEPITFTTGSMGNDRQLMLSKNVHGTEYCLYKQIIDENDTRINPDGSIYYRTQLTLDVIESSNTKTYIVDSDVYHDPQHGGQQPAMLFDLISNQLHIFYNSKVEGNHYKLNGYNYVTSLSDIHFNKETVFNGYNWGWFPYYEYNNGQIIIHHFSYAGYYAMKSARNSDGSWSNTRMNYIKPDAFAQMWEQAEHVLVIEPEVPDTQHDYVDLGLPSGTLWATCNVGATCPEDYGDYFAWGETEPKDNYDWSTYKWCNGSSTTITKYCVYSNYGTVDGKRELELEDDAAYVNWGSVWRLPSKEQIHELRDRGSWTWTTRNGVEGQLVTGPNGNTLFFPATGYRWKNSLDEVGSLGRYWSRTLATYFSTEAVSLFFDGGYWNFWEYERRYGFTVRAVRLP